MICNTSNKLMKIIMQYRNEIKKGDYTHLNDLIGASVLAELTRGYSSIMNYINFNDISLDTIIEQGFFAHIEEFIVPDRYEIEYQLRLLEEKLNGESIPVGLEEGIAAYTWIDMMQIYGMIKEGEIINPSDFKLSNFINDQKIYDILPLKDCPNSLYIGEIRANINDKVLSLKKKKERLKVDNRKDLQLQAKIDPISRCR